jgi:general L-amino acid transport system permease protein
VQGVAVALTVAALWWLGHNIVVSLARHGLSLGFGFLNQPANFAVEDTAWLRFSPEQSIGRAILAGLLNTALVSALGCVLAIAVGFVVGVLRLSPHPAVGGLMRAGVELIRNTPLLLLLLLVATSLQGLPPAASALHPAPGVFLSNRGLVVPTIRVSGLTLALAGAALALAVWHRALGRVGWRGAALAAAAGVASLVLRRPTVQIPRLEGFNFTGGTTLSPEFAALLAALVLHQAAHISEVVRGALFAVPRGQRDAARALGLSPWQVLRLVTLPLALRAMVPLLASNCVSLVKNSSLAVAIGFPDVVSVLNTSGNQTGHNVETMLLMVGLYLSLSVAVAVALNRYNTALLARGAPAP